MSTVGLGGSAVCTWASGPACGSDWAKSSGTLALWGEGSDEASWVGGTGAEERGPSVREAAPG